MTVTSDARYALRLLAKGPAFTLTAVLSLTLGISGTAAIFSLADALLLRPRAGVADPARLVDIGRSTRGEGLDNFGYPLFEAMRDANTTLTGIAAVQMTPQVMSLGNALSSDRVFAAVVSGNYFEVVGTRVAAGRFFLPEEDRTPDTHPVAVLSYQFWSRRFGRRADTVGSSIRLNNRAYTVIGVAEPGFTGTTFIGADVWVPMAMEAHVRASDHSLLREHGPVWLTAIGRLAPGASIRQARDELDAIMKGYLKSQGDARVERWDVAVARSERVPAPLAGPVVGFIGMLGVLTALVLVIACSNVAGMLLARGIDRRHELATRVAVGASRARLVRQLLLEGAVLAAIAGACSIPLSYFLIRLLAGFQPSIPIPIALDLRVDPRVHAMTLALAACAALAFALLPALQTTRVDLTAALRAASATPDRRRTWLRQGLVVAQVTVALVLLVVAGLFLRSIYAAASMDVGFETRNVDTLKIDTHIGGYASDAQGIRVVEDLMDRFRAIPGVLAVGASRMVPLQDSGLGLGDLRAPGYTGPGGTASIDADWDVVSADYFRALQIPIVAGRPFGPQDRAGAPFAAIVNRTMAERIWPGQDPIGRTLVQDLGRGATRTLLIVGVAQNAKYRFITESPRNFIYVPLAQQFLSEVTFYVRRAPGPSRAADLRQAVVGFDPMLPVIHTETLEQATSITTVPQRLAAWIAGIVGSLGLFLAALGLYGVTAFAVSQRRREIAIRIAVGASHRAVVWLVLRQAILLAVVGAIAGIGIAGTVARLLRSFLIGLEPLDPVTFGLAAMLLGCVMFTAAWTPARRAGMANPVQWLRAE